MPVHKLSHVIATFFGVGYFPIASGTAGSLAALPLAAVAAYSWPAGIVLIIALIAIGIPAATRVALERGDSDPGIVVIDEVIGMMISCLGLGLGPARLVCAFLIFRFFDIVKPPPCRRLELLPGGVGIVADDVFAGFYTLVTLVLLRWRGIL